MKGSIRRRVVLLALAVQVLAAVAALAVSLEFVHRALQVSLDAEIRSRMTALLALIDEPADGSDRPVLDHAREAAPGADLFYVQDAAGRRIEGSADWMTPEKLRPGAPSAAWNLKVGDTPYRALAVREVPLLDEENTSAPPTRVSLFYATPSRHMQEQFEEALQIAVGVSVLSLLLSSGATWWAVGRGMRPLTQFAQWADRIEAGGMTSLASAAASRAIELAPLERALDAMVQRLQEAFQRERRFVSDAAHELKTTVAIQKSTLQLLEQDKPSEREYRDGVARALEDTDRTERLVARMLLLASLEHASVRPDDLGKVELLESLRGAAEQLAPLARIKNVTVEVCSTGKCLVRGRETELHQLWICVMENAIHHSPSGSVVRAEVKRTVSGLISISIRDEGPGIRPDDLPHVFERFYRSDKSRSRNTGGFGLGLAIAKAIIERNEGSLQIASVPGEGTMVIVELGGEVDPSGEASA